MNQADSHTETDKRKIDYHYLDNMPTVHTNFRSSIFQPIWFYSSTEQQEHVQ